MNSDAEILSEIRAVATERCRDHDSAHNALHLTRVVDNARTLAEAEAASGRSVDLFVVEAVGWLHDLVQLPKGSGPAGESARRSAASAAELLESYDVSTARRENVLHAIATHSFSGRLRPETIEAAIVQDADRLDALGAIGIARLWVTGVALGGELYAVNDPAAERRELDDRAFGLDHIERKLLRLPETMNTPAGRREAERRADFVRLYRSEFLRELGSA